MEQNHYNTMDTRVNTQIYLEKKRFESEICLSCHCTSPVVSLGVITQRLASALLSLLLSLPCLSCAVRCLKTKTFTKKYTFSLLSPWKSNPKLRRGHAQKMLTLKGNPDSQMRLDSWYCGCYLSIDCMSNFHFLQTSTGGARVQGEVVRRPNIYRTDLCDPVKSISRINDALLVRLRNSCCVTIVTLVLIVMRNGSWSLRQVLTTL